MRNNDKAHSDAPRLNIVYRRICELKLNPNNPRIHPPGQIRLLRKALKTFTFLVPVLIDTGNNVIAGHARLEAARLEHLDEVPTIEVSHLSRHQIQAFILADNRLSDLGRPD